MADGKLRGRIEAALILLPFLVAVLLTKQHPRLYLWSAMAGMGELLCRPHTMRFNATLYPLLLPIYIAIANEKGLERGMAMSLGSILPRELLPCMLLLDPLDDLLPWMYADAVDLIHAVGKTSLGRSEVHLLAMCLIIGILMDANSPEKTLQQGALVAGLLIVGCLSPYLTRYIAIARIPRIKRPHQMAKQHTRLAVTFYVGLLLGLVPCYAWVGHCLQSEPIAWMLSYILVDGRLAILAYWLASLSLAAVLLPRMDSTIHPLSLDRRRKFFHALVVVMFLPTLQRDPSLARLALTAALLLFLFCEMLRMTTLPPIGAQVHAFLAPFTDSRDTQGPVIVSHIFLLLGIALPLWLDCAPSWRICTGVVCLGCGDASASVFGGSIGRLRWPQSRKTLEGTLAFIFAAVLGASVACSLDPATKTVPFAGITGVATIAGALEAFSGMNDNVVVPVYVWCMTKVFI